jgi:preprotein translocase subunit SecE
MSKETAVAKNEFLREVFQVGLYKRSQGKIARQVTFAAVATVFVLASWRLNVFLSAKVEAAKSAWMSDSLIYAIAGVVLVGGLWLAYRMVNVPKFADFLIAVEAEMAKVSWPSRLELYRHSIVVIVVIFIMVFMLFAFDFVWGWLFSWLGVLRT